LIEIRKEGGVHGFNFPGQCHLVCPAICHPG
jgi:hypothetical protein